MMGRWPVLFILTLGSFRFGSQGERLDGTWELKRIFRTGPTSSTRAVPLDSTAYLRLTLTSHPGGWFTGKLYRRLHGDVEQTKLGGGTLGDTGRYVLGADFDRPVETDAKTAAWLAGPNVLRLGTSFVPDADSLELVRVAPDAPIPTTVTEVVGPS
jgi:hypothetical protein